MFTTLRTETGDLVQIPNNAFFQRIIKCQQGHIDITLEEQLERDEPFEWSDE